MQPGRVTVVVVRYASRPCGASLAPGAARCGSGAAERPWAVVAARLGPPGPVLEPRGAPGRAHLVKRLDFGSETAEMVPCASIRPCLVLQSVRIAKSHPGTSSRARSSLIYAFLKITAPPANRRKQAYSDDPNR